MDDFFIIDIQKLVVIRDPDSWAFAEEIEGFVINQIPAENFFKAKLLIENFSILGYKIADFQNSMIAPGLEPLDWNTRTEIGLKSKEDVAMFIPYLNIGALAHSQN
jgi:hypothetical protein